MLIEQKKPGSLYIRTYLFSSSTKKHRFPKLMGKVEVHKDSDHSRSFYIRWVKIYKGYRNKGYGQEMFGEVLKRLKKIAKAHQIKSIFLDVLHNNHRAIHIYGKFGFRRRGSDGVLIPMRLKLSQ